MQARDCGAMTSLGSTAQHVCRCGLRTQHNNVTVMTNTHLLLYKCTPCLIECVFIMSALRSRSDILFYPCAIGLYLLWPPLRGEHGRFAIFCFRRNAIVYWATYAIGPLSVLSVTLVYCSQMVGRIKMPLGTEVGLGQGDFVDFGDPAPPPIKRDTAPNFRLMSTVAHRLDGSICHLVRR